MRGRTAGVEPRTVVFVLAGQSNMVGRDRYDGGPGFPDGTLQVARSGAESGGADGDLVPAAPTLDHWDATPGSAGPALQFVIDYQGANPGDTVVLVPAARGGTSFSRGEWGVGNPLSNDLICRVNALFSKHPDFVLMGILWLQGETDATLMNATYQAQLDEQFSAFRTHIAAATQSAPILTGRLLQSWVAGSPNRERVDAIIRDTPKRVAYSAVVSSDGLTGADHIHFDAASYRVLGSRYFDALGAARANALPVP